MPVGGLGGRPASQASRRGQHVVQQSVRSLGGQEQGRACLSALLTDYVSPGRNSLAGGAIAELGVGERGGEWPAIVYSDFIPQSCFFVDKTIFIKQVE